MFLQCKYIVFWICQTQQFGLNIMVLLDKFHGKKCLTDEDQREE